MMLNPNILDEGNQMEILDVTDFYKTGDQLDIVLRCNNCGQPTKYAYTRMCSGFVGCDNKININGNEVECYFGDLMPRVMKYKNSDDKDLYEMYRSGNVYRWRDEVDGGIKK